MCVRNAGAALLPLKLVPERACRSCAQPRESSVDVGVTAANQESESHTYKYVSCRSHTLHRSLLLDVPHRDDKRSKTVSAAAAGEGRFTHNWNFMKNGANSRV